MKYVITELNQPNESVMFSNSILGKYSLNTYFGEFKAKSCNAVEFERKYEFVH